MNIADARPVAVARVRDERVSRALLIWGVPLALLIGGVALALSVGAVGLSPERVLNGLLDRDDPLARTIVWELRLPRVAIAILVGACLATSGALLQGVTRNPLADPHILGLTAGGGLAARAGWCCMLARLSNSSEGFQCSNPLIGVRSSMARSRI